MSSILELLEDEELGLYLDILDERIMMEKVKQLAETYTYLEKQEIDKHNRTLALLLLAFCKYLDYHKGDKMTPLTHTMGGGVVPEEQFFGTEYQGVRTAGIIVADPIEKDVKDESEMTRALKILAERD